jgi:dihydroxyacid dehydratase/phosphogluconate dehydratase
MDATTNIKARLPSRPVTEGPARAPHRSFDHALIARECGIDASRFDVFKKTPYIVDSKPGGRYVAKDIVEVGGIPLPMTMLRDHGFLHGDCVTVTGRTTAENLKSVKRIPNQDVARPANVPITVTGGVVGLKGNPECVANRKAEKVSHADA